MVMESHSDGKGTGTMLKMMSDEHLEKLLGRLRKRADVKPNSKPPPEGIWDAIYRIESELNKRKPKQTAADLIEEGFNAMFTKGGD